MKDRCSPMHFHSAFYFWVLHTIMYQSSGSDGSGSLSDALKIMNDIYIGPELKLVSGWSDQQSVVSGTLDVDFDWNLTAFAEYSTDNANKMDLRDVISVEELITGGSGRIKRTEFDWTDLVTHYKHRRAAMTYVGDFSQIVDGTCYPFDEATATFTLQLQSDWTATWEAKLFCKAHLDCVAYDSDGNVLHEETDPWRLWGGMPYTFAVSKIVVSQPFSAKGFAWSSMTCQKSPTRGRIVCSLTGMRAWKTPLSKWVIPGFVMLVIGFSSVFIPVAQKMPRVATTMIAMLTFINRSTAAFNAMSTTGTSWILEFYVLGTISLCVNMLGHVVSFRDDRLAPVVGDLSLAVGFFGILFCLAVSFHLRACEQISGFYSITLTLITALCFLGVITRAALKYHAVRAVLNLGKSLSTAEDQEDAETLGVAVKSL